MEIQTTGYPVHRNWDEKALSMPNIPRGSEGQVAVLKSILSEVKANSPSKRILSFEGSDSKISLEQLCIRLRPMRLVIKAQYGWILSEESLRWLESEDNIYLAATLCANIRFLAEVLCFLDVPRSSNSLNDIANGEYGLGWQTLSAINIRLLWLRQLGLVEYQAFSQLYSITETGKEFLKSVEVVDPTRVAPLLDETENEQSVPVSEWAIAYCKLGQEQLVLRKQTIGYIPGYVSNFYETLTEYLTLIRSGSTYGALRSYAKSNYGIAGSSFSSFMSTLVNLGFVVRQTDELYAATEIADKWLEDGGAIEAICCLHNKFLFVFELLKELDNKRATYKELAAMAKVSYGFEKENISEIQRRIGIFKTAKLVRNVSVNEYTLTKCGKRLLELVPLQIPRLITSNEPLCQASSSDPNDSLYMELRVASKNAANSDSTRFERAVKTAFEALGFTASWLGGSGKTDVLIQAPGAPQNAFTAAVDAKSTSADNVTDSIVDFDTLKEHRKKHGADFSVVVGRSFGERLVQRAIDHSVVLLTVDNLEELIRQHFNVPLKVAAYKKIFENPGIADIGLIDIERSKVARFGKLIHSVMNCLLEESLDEVTEGLLETRDVYRSLRNAEGLDAPPAIDEISNMLEFLSSPLIGCAGKTKNSYYAVGSLADAAGKFAFYSKSCLSA